MSTEPNDTPLSLDSLIADLNAEYAAAPKTLPTGSDAAPAPTPEGEGQAAAPGATAGAEAHVPPTDGTKPAATPDETPTPAPKKAEARKEAGESDTEARLRKAENDLALAKKGQAAADRRANAWEQASQLEAQRIQLLKAQERLTQEEVERGPLLKQAWVQRADAEAAEAESAAEQRRIAAETEQAREEREAENEFKSQALTLAADMVALGLKPEDADYEQLLRDTLASEKYAPDVALTWTLQSIPEEAARIYDRMMSAAKADVKQEIEKIAAARQETAKQKAAVNQYDRTSSSGPSTGGPDPIPDMPLEEMWSRVKWKS